MHPNSQLISIFSFVIALKFSLTINSYKMQSNYSDSIQIKLDLNILNFVSFNITKIWRKFEVSSLADFLKFRLFLSRFFNKGGSLYHATQQEDWERSKKLRNFYYLKKKKKNYTNYWQRYIKLVHVAGLEIYGIIIKYIYF